MNTTISKREITTVNAALVKDFSVTVDKAANGRDWDVWATLNGETKLIAFAVKNKTGKGYTFLSLSMTSFPAALYHQANLLDWLQSDATEGGGLTLTEVRKRGALLGGIWLAGKTLELASA